MADERRRILLISRQFQFRLIAKITGVNIAATTVFGLAIYFFIAGLLGSGTNSKQQLVNISDALIPLILLVTISSLIFSTVAVSYIVLSASHKISGALYRLNRALGGMTQGELSPFGPMRKGDETRDTYSSLEALREKLWSDLSLIREKAVIIKETSGKRKAASEYKKALEDLDKITSSYRF